MDCPARGFQSVSHEVTLSQRQNKTFQSFKNLVKPSVNERMMKLALLNATNVNINKCDFSGRQFDPGIKSFKICTPI